MTDTVHCSRRAVLAAAPALATAAMAGIISPAHAGPKDAGGSMTVLEPVTLELVLNIVATCSSPERMGPADASKDGIRNEIWPIIGGRFEGKGMRGIVVPGGGRFPSGSPRWSRRRRCPVPAQD
jgi:hypothetical protein